MDAYSQWGNKLEYHYLYDAIRSAEIHVATHPNASVRIIEVKGYE